MLIHKERNDSLIIFTDRKTVTIPIYCFTITIVALWTRTPKWSSIWEGNIIISKLVNWWRFRTFSVLSAIYIRFLYSGLSKSILCWLIIFIGCMDLNYQIVSYSLSPRSWETDHFHVLRIQERWSRSSEKENRNQLHIKEEKSVMKTLEFSFLLFKPWIMTSSYFLLVNSASS